MLKRLLFQRNFATFPARSANEPLHLDAIIGISHSVLLFLHYSKFGSSLDQLQTQNGNLGEKWRKMTEVMLQAQLYLIAPFGFTRDIQGIQDYHKASVTTISNLNPKKHQSDLNDLEEINKDTWAILIKRAFGIKEPSWLDLQVARSLSVGIKNQLMNKSTLKIAEDIAKEKGLTPTLKMDKIQNQVVIPSYKHGMESIGIAFSENSFAMTSASLQVWMQKDPTVAQAMQQGLTEVMKRTPPN